MSAKVKRAALTRFHRRQDKEPDFDARQWAKELEPFAEGLLSGSPADNNQSDSAKPSTAIAPEG